MSDWICRLLEIRTGVRTPNPTCGSNRALLLKEYAQS